MAKDLIKDLESKGHEPTSITSILIHVADKRLLTLLEVKYILDYKNALEKRIIELTPSGEKNSSI